MQAPPSAALVHVPRGNPRHLEPPGLPLGLTAILTVLLSQGWGGTGAGQSGCGLQGGQESPSVFVESGSFAEEKASI